MALFHVSIFVRDLAEARSFYGGVLGFPTRRELSQSLHFDGFGNQIVLHELPGYSAKTQHRRVENDEFVVPHFGLILDQIEWRKMEERLRSLSVDFESEPHRRFQDKPYEQLVMFVLDPSGNAIEFKSYTKARPTDWC